MSTDSIDPYLDCFEMHDRVPPLVPGRPRRDWMDHFNQKQPYRCLPMTMANSTGWEILCPFDITIEWDGGYENECVEITSKTPDAHISGLAQAHFKAGIITFHTGYLFRTPPGWAVWCMGPPNKPVHGIYPLSGLVETDWLPFPFTMNWQMTQAGTVEFKKGDCFCFITLTEHHKLQAVEPELKSFKSDPELKENYGLWRTSRIEFSKKLQARDPDTVKSAWQKHYMRGENPSGESNDAAAQHLTKRRLHMPVRKKT